ncbi:MAG: hypothetical protein ACI8SR_002679 [Oceanicoccus sp.]|jgi:hypothetical protein
MSTILSPKVGENRLSEMTSPDTTPETKCWAARWYAEMMVELFLSDTAKQKKKDFESLSLGNKIKEISEEYSEKLISSLYLIEDLGNQASHFKKGRAITEAESIKAVENAIGLFDLILVDLFKNQGLAKTLNTAKIFSTFLPSIRVNVLAKLLDFSKFDNNSEYDIGVLHKYLLALTKNGQREKARRLIKKLLKKETIDQDMFTYWENSINVISNNSKNLPIPKSIEDCKRNFDDVLIILSNEDLSENSRLIEIFNILLESVTPSEMGDLIGNQLFPA